MADSCMILQFKRPDPITNKDECAALLSDALSGVESGNVDGAVVLIWNKWNTEASCYLAGLPRKDLEAARQAIDAVLHRL